jgi:cytochrome c oxidase subunit 1
VSHLDEFFHRKYQQDHVTGEIKQVATAEELLEIEERNADAHIHLPSASYWPLVLAIGTGVMALGVIYAPLLIAVGGAIVLWACFGWVLEPSVADESDYDPPAGGATKELATLG